MPSALPRDLRTGPWYGCADLRGAVFGPFRIAQKFCAYRRKPLEPLYFLYCVKLMIWLNINLPLYDLSASARGELAAHMESRWLSHERDRAEPCPHFAARGDNDDEQPKCDHSGGSDDG